MNNRNQISQSLYQARLAFDDIEVRLNQAENQARATLARIKLARQSINAWRVSVVHEACEAQAHRKGPEGGGESPPSEELTS